MTTHDPKLATEANAKAPGTSQTKATGKGRKKAPMKETPADTAVKDGVQRLTKTQLRNFCERYEAVDREIAELKQAQKDIMTEAHGQGINIKSFRIALSERKRDIEDVREERAITDFYRDLLDLM